MTTIMVISYKIPLILGRNANDFQECCMNISRGSKMFLSLNVCRDGIKLSEKGLSNFLALNSWNLVEKIAGNFYSFSSLRGILFKIYIYLHCN